MHADENAHIVANPSAAGTDWGVSWCAGECLYSNKSGRRRHRLGVEGAAGGRRGGVFLPPPHYLGLMLGVPLMQRQKLLQGHCNEAEPRIFI